MEVGLSSAIQTTLSSTQRISGLLERTQEHLSTGRNDSPRPGNAFAAIVASGLSNKASDLLAVKDGLGQSASQLQVAQSGLEFADKLLDQMKAVSRQFDSTSSVEEQNDLTAQFDVLKTQLDHLVRDSSYGGTNLISATPDNLDVALNDDGSSNLVVTGQAADSATLGVDITDIATINAAAEQVRSTAASIGSNASIIEIREQFTDQLVNDLQEGAAKLVATDLNEEAANSLSLATRGQLAVAATELAANSERTILQLF